MRELVKVTGMVTSSKPVGEYDKRLVLLTRERGKIAAFARGARKQNSVLMAGSRPFSFGRFILYEGRDSYTVQSMEISNYFEELSSDMEGACYGFYFMELAEYYTRENLDESQMLKLLYQSLRALLKPSLPNPLIQLIFEMKAMVINGEYSETPPIRVCEATEYTLKVIIASPIENLYTFTVSVQVLDELKRCIKIFKAKYLDKTFHSLDILESMISIDKFPC